MKVKDFLEFAEKIKQATEKDTSMLDVSLSFYDGNNSWEITELEIVNHDPENEEPGYISFTLDLDGDMD